jgi:SulP family sulfate permease
LARHPENEEIPGLAIFRVDAPLFFANANVADKEIRNRIALREPTPQAIIIDLGATSDLDIASADMLTDLIGDLQSINIQVMLAQVRGAVRERMRKTGLMERVGQENIFLSVEGAVHAFQKAAAQETNSLEETSAIEPPPPNQDSTTS